MCSTQLLGCNLDSARHDIGIGPYSLTHSIEIAAITMVVTMGDASVKEIWHLYAGCIYLTL